MSVWMDGVVRNRVGVLRRWAVVQMLRDPYGEQGVLRAVLVSSHFTVRAAVAARTRRHRTSAGAVFRVVPSRWAPARRLRAWLSLELAQRGPQSTHRLWSAGVLPREVMMAALNDLVRSGAVVYEVEPEIEQLADALSWAMDVPRALLTGSEVGQWRLSRFRPADVAAAAAVPGGGWTWAVPGKGGQAWKNDK